jgi:class 3 adenylate cyclase/tetratricopeptide (TPR) repeat protein
MAAPEPPSLLRIPDHELIRCIGRGGYGEVWLARNVIGTYRAVKIVYRKSFRDDRPFEREFTGIKNFAPISLKHPGLVAILHIGRNERAGNFFYIMEIADDLTRGTIVDPESYTPKTLTSEMGRRGKIPLRNCVEIGVALTSALDFLHRGGLIHRDIKPSNIIFVGGEAKLADIGLVAEIDEAVSFAGTMGYIAPEILSGAQPATEQADIYSLGKVLYEISTGKDRQEFPALPAEMPKAADGSLFRRFNEITLKACETQPQLRFRSAREMQTALSQTSERKSGGTSVSSAAEEPRADATERQRKFLTVLCVEFAMVDEVDPEELPRIVQSCCEAVRPAIERYEGTITPVQGERLIAVFGAPIACEDHAQRAAYAALNLKEALVSYARRRKTKDEAGFEARMSLNSGLVVTGQNMGKGNVTASGEAVSTATRLLSLADAGQIVVSEETCKSIQDYFSISPLGERKLPGKAAPVKLYELTERRQHRSRLEASAQRGLTRFVGRTRELGTLKDRFAEAREGHGQIVLLAGEAGVGKSRLLRELRESLTGTEITWLEGRSISFGSQMAYLPIIDFLKQLFGIEEADDESAVTSKIESGLNPLGKESASALAAIKDFLAGDSAEEAARKIDPQQRRLQTLEIIRKLLFGCAQRAPLILVIEDLHWIDKASEDFLVSLADSLAMMPVLMLLTYRPGYRNPFPERSYLTRTVLRQLTEEETVRLAAEMLAGTQLPAEFRRLIVGKADGNPFFIEEMIKSLIEGGIIDQREGQFQFAQTRAAAQVPDTIQGVIMGRIDRLDACSRKALQLASVIGREFAVTLLQTIADLREPVTQCLQKLKALELIYERSLFPEHVCMFKHALTQEVAYNTLLIQDRKELHSMVAAAIEELYAARLPEFYGLLAYHYEQGEEWERALEYLERAAEQCRGIGAYREEAFQIGRAIAIAERLGERELLTDLRGKRGTALAHVGLWAEAMPDLEYALAKLPRESDELRAELLLELAGVHFWDLNAARMRVCAAEALPIAKKVGRSDLAAGAIGWLGAAQQVDGDSVAASQTFERALAAGDGFAYPSLANYPLNLYMRGCLKEAVELGRQSAAKLADSWAATFGLPHLALALAGSGQYAEALKVFDEARKVGARYENWSFQVRAISMSAGFHLDLFDYAGNEAIALEARERAHSSGFQPTIVSSGIDLIVNYARRGQVADAEKMESEASELAAMIGGWHRWLWSLRLKHARAEIALARQDWNGALRWANEAIEESGARQRLKYVVAGLMARSKALAKLGRTREALPGLTEALERARPMGDPAILFRALAQHLEVEGSDLLFAEARGVAERIVTALPTDEMRACFLGADPVKLVQLEIS